MCVFVGGCGCGRLRYLSCLIHLHSYSLYPQLYTLLEEHLSRQLRDIAQSSATDARGTLTRLGAAWRAHDVHMLLIREIFLTLDRSAFFRHRSRGKSLHAMGLELFGKGLVDAGLAPLVVDQLALLLRTDRRVSSTCIHRHSKKGWGFGSSFGFGLTFSSPPRRPYLLPTHRRGNPNPKPASNHYPSNLTPPPHTFFVLHPLSCQSPAVPDLTSRAFAHTITSMLVTLRLYDASAFPVLLRHLREDGAALALEQWTRGGGVSDGDPTDVGPYLIFVESFLDQERDRVKSCLTVASVRPLLLAAETVLLQDHAEHIARGLAPMMDSGETENVRRMARLLALSGDMARVKDMWSTHVKCKVEAVVNDVARDAEMVTRLIQLRQELDQLALLALAPGNDRATVRIMDFSAMQSI